MKKFIMLFTLGLALTLSGCSEDTETVTVLTFSGYEPYEMVDTSGNLTGFDIELMEALAAEKPVITTKFNGATDLFIENQHGKVIDTPENINALAEAIVYFTDTGNIKKFTERIISDNLKEKISINRAARQIIELYAYILAKRDQK